jgi:cardiolipin synthase
MRSLIHYGLAFTLLAIAADAVLVSGDGARRVVFVGAVHALWISGVLTVLVLNVGFLSTIDGRMLSHLNGANIITLGRVFLLPTLGYLIAYGLFALAAPLYLALALSDVADGLWARRRGQVTKLGIIFDPLADVAFHIWVFASMWWAQRIPTWILVIVLLRYGLLIFGGVFLYYVKGQIRVFPTPFGKGTGVLVCAASAALLVFPGPPDSATALPGWIVTALGIVLATTVLHVLAIGWVNLKLPLSDTPVGPQVRGRWARELKKRRSGGGEGRGSRGRRVR